MKKIYFFIIFVVLISCNQKKEEVEKRDWKAIDKKLIDINKYLVKEDKERIESYIKRNGWEMLQTETGLWYEITQQTDGKIVEENDIATIKYKVELLDGTVCYDSDLSGELSFKIGIGNVASGVQEGIKLMKEGEKARFIIPPHLAYGLVGDDNKIPPRSIIVYYIEITKIE